MEALAQVADTIASDYHGVMGDRVKELLAFAEDSGDLETFRQRLNEMLEEGPAPQTVEAVQNATWGSRLLGLFRTQR